MDKTYIADYGTPGSVPFNSLSGVVIAGVRGYILFSADSIAIVDIEIEYKVVLL